MATELDPRIVRVGVEVNGRLQTYDGLAVTASGTKFANANENECEVKITNLSAATRDYLLTETSPFNQSRTRKRLVVEAGRQSTGASLLFMGDIVSAVGSQPPDVVVTLKATTGAFSKGDIVQRSQPGMCTLRTIAAQVAKDLGAVLDFQCTDKQIANYTFTGGALRQIDQLGAYGRVNAYLDDGALILKDYGQPKRGSTRVLNVDTGMVGVPEFTERGIKVKMLFDNQTTVGSGLQIASKMVPAANGLFTVYKLGFEVANRDTPFYLIAEAERVDGAAPGDAAKKVELVKTSGKKK